jgi:hypothetical protein
MHEPFCHLVVRMTRRHTRVAGSNFTLLLRRVWLRRSRALLEVDAFAQAIEHGGKGDAILRIAGEDLVGDGKAVAIEHEADRELLTVGSVIARMESSRISGVTRDGWHGWPKSGRMRRPNLSRAPQRS